MIETLFFIIYMKDETRWSRYPVPKMGNAANH